MKNFTLKISLILLLFCYSSQILVSPLLAQNQANTNNEVLNKYSNIAFEINSLLSNKNLAKSSYSISIYSLTNSQYVYQKNPTLPLTPASTTKLFHMFSAFHLFGDGGAFATETFADGEINDGVLNGDLYIVGCGDPFLSSANLEDLAEKTLNNSGIKHITGSVYADDSFFDPITDRKIYSGDKDVVQSMPPVSGFTFEGSAIKILATSSNIPGAPVRLQSFPRSSAIKFVNNARVGGAVAKAPAKPAVKTAPQKSSSKSAVKPLPLKTKSKIQIKNNKTKQKETKTNSKSKQAPNKKAAPNNKNKTQAKSKKRADLFDFYPQGFEPLAQKYGSAKKGKVKAKTTQKAKSSGALSIVPQYQANGEIIVTVSGVLPANRSQTKSFISTKPAMIAAGFFKSALEDGGVKIDGAFGVKRLDKSKNIKSLAAFKRPMVDVMYPIGKNSDNYVAEHLCKAVGGYLGNNQNSAKHAGAYASSLIDSLAGKQLNTILNDGSGLSRRNKASAESEIQLLIGAAKSPFFNSFYNTLAIAGIDGTLRKRMHGGNAYGNVFAKTGTHGNVSALSGYVKSKSGENFAFAIIFNGGGVGYYKQVENSICEILAK